MSTPWIGAMNFASGGQLASQLSANQLLVDAAHVFEPTVTKADQEEIGLTAKVAGLLRTGAIDGDRVGGQLTNGKFLHALHSVEKAAASIKAPAEDVFGLTIGLLNVPAGVVDAFALSAVAGVAASKAQGKRRGLMLPKAHAQSSGLADFIDKSHTRAGLMKAIAHASTLRSKHDDAFDSGLGHPMESARLARFEKALELFASKPDALTEILKLVSADDFKGADKVAQKHLGSVGIQGGTTLDNPPALADALLVSVIPTCDTLHFARNLA